jgi:hypothetical protein
LEVRVRFCSKGSEGVDTADVCVAIVVTGGGVTALRVWSNESL